MLPKTIFPNRARPRACRNGGVGGVLARPPDAASGGASFRRSLPEFLPSRGAVRPLAARDGEW
jgi:hypothetical protein